MRYIANNTNQPDDSYVKFIMTFVSHMLWIRPLQDNGYIGLTTENDLISSWIVEKNLTYEFQEFLSKLEGVNLNLTEIQKSNYSTKLLGEVHKNKTFVFDNIASNGTKSLELLFYWSQKFTSLSLLYIDDFDAYYHFELAINIVKYIITFDQLQVLLTTHSAYLASNEYLRPYCYFILENKKLSSFSESTSRELRESHNLEKMLINGEFNE